MHGISTILSSEENKKNKWNLLLKGQAKSIAEELGRLKGSLMKAGQMLSVYGEHFLPKEANDILKSLQMDSQAVAWDQIEKVLVSELSPEKLEKLKIDEEPIGTASLGQVHRAQIRATGEWVAIKVQYPGVEKAIDSDLKSLKSFLNMLKLIPSGPYLDSVLNEIKEMLMQETDYYFEADNTIKYGELLKNDARFVVPKVFKEFSTKKVITTSLEVGIRPDDPAILTLKQSRRNQIAWNFLDLYFKELFDWGVVQTDPHLGNYKIKLSPDGRDQIVLLDFGAVRNYPDEFLIHYRFMIKAAFEENPKELTKQALQLKFLFSEDKEELRTAFEQFCLLTVEPFKSTEAEGYDWKKSDLPGRLTRKAFAIIQGFPLRPPPKEIVFLDRKTAGVFIFLSVLGAKFDSKPLLLRYLEKLS